MPRGRLILKLSLIVVSILLSHVLNASSLQKCEIALTQKAGQIVSDAFFQHPEIIEKFISVLIEDHNLFFGPSLLNYFDKALVSNGYLKGDKGQSSTAFVTSENSKKNIQFLKKFEDLNKLEQMKIVNSIWNSIEMDLELNLPDVVNGQDIFVRLSEKNKAMGLSKILNNDESEKQIVSLILLRKAILEIVRQPGGLDVIKTFIFKSLPFQAQSLMELQFNIQTGKKRMNESVGLLAGTQWMTPFMDMFGSTLVGISTYVGLSALSIGWYGWHTVQGSKAKQQMTKVTEDQVQASVNLAKVMREHLAKNNLIVDRVVLPNGLFEVRSLEVDGNLFSNSSDQSEANKTVKLSNPPRFEDISKYCETQIKILQTLVKESEGLKISYESGIPFVLEGQHSDQAERSKRFEFRYQQIQALIHYAEALLPKIDNSIKGLDDKIEHIKENIDAYTHRDPKLKESTAEALDIRLNTLEFGKTTLINEKQKLITLSSDIIQEVNLLNKISLSDSSRQTQDSNYSQLISDYVNFLSSHKNGAVEGLVTALQQLEPQATNAEQSIEKVKPFIGTDLVRTSSAGDKEIRIPSEGFFYIKKLFGKVQKIDYGNVGQNNTRIVITKHGEVFYFDGDSRYIVDPSKQNKYRAQYESIKQNENRLLLENSRKQIPIKGPVFLETSFGYVIGSDYSWHGKEGRTIVNDENGKPFYHYERGTLRWSLPIDYKRQKALKKVWLQQRSELPDSGEFFYVEGDELKYGDFSSAKAEGFELVKDQMGDLAILTSPLKVTPIYLIDGRKLDIPESLTEQLRHLAIPIKGDFYYLDGGKIKKGNFESLADKPDNLFRDSSGILKIGGSGASIFMDQQDLLASVYENKIPKPGEYFVMDGNGEVNLFSPQKEFVDAKVEPGGKIKLTYKWDDYYGFSNQTVIVDLERQYQFKKYFYRLGIPKKGDFYYEDRSLPRKGDYSWQLDRGISIKQKNESTLIYKNSKNEYYGRSFRFEIDLRKQVQLKKLFDRENVPKEGEFYYSLNGYVMKGQYDWHGHDGKQILPNLAGEIVYLSAEGASPVIIEPQKQADLKSYYDRMGVPPSGEFFYVSDNLVRKGDFSWHGNNKKWIVQLANGDLVLQEEVKGYYGPEIKKYPIDMDQQKKLRSYFEKEGIPLLGEVYFVADQRVRKESFNIENNDKIRIFKDSTGKIIYQELIKDSYYGNMWKSYVVDLSQQDYLKGIYQGIDIPQEGRFLYLVNGKPREGDYAWKNVKNREIKYNVDGSLVYVERQHDSYYGWTSNAYKIVKSETLEPINYRDRLMAAFKEIPMLEKYQGEEFRGVKYLKKSERERYRLHFKNGLIYDANNELFDTEVENRSAISEFSTMAIFVMNNVGNIFASKYFEKDRFHHSSLISGESVVVAGMMRVSKGRIVSIDNRSGHYKGDANSLNDFAQFLRANGIIVPDNAIELITEDEASTEAI